jgi:hypothetical protein
MPDPEEIGAKILAQKMNECREHHFGSDTRCKVCAMQARYYAEVMTALNGWSKRDKEDPVNQWQYIVDSYKCKPHTHENLIKCPKCGCEWDKYHHYSNTQKSWHCINCGCWECYKPENPMLKLYDMEAEHGQS